MARIVYAGIEKTVYEPNSDVFVVKKEDACARKMYFGVPKNIYKTKEVAITAENVSDHFRIYNGGNAFELTEGVFSANNIGQMSTTATTRLEALDDIHSIKFDWRAKTEETHDRFTIAKSGEEVVNVTGEQEGKWTGSLAKGESIAFGFSKDIYGEPEGECAIVENMVVTATDYENYDIISVAAKVLKGYVGDNDDIAQQFFGPRDLIYKGVAGTLYGAEYSSAGNNASCVLFAGGDRSWSSADDTVVGIVKAFDRNLVLHTVENLSCDGYSMAAATAGDEYVIFFGGRERSTRTDIYDNHLTHIVPDWFSGGCWNAAGFSFKGNAMFAGGTDYDTDYNRIYMYDENLTLTLKSGVFSGSRGECEGVPLGNMFFCAGGGGYWRNADVFDEDWTRVTVEMSSGRVYKGGATEKHAMFIGEDGIVDVLDEELTLMTMAAGTVNEARADIDTETLGGMMIATNGYDVEAYDDNLTIVEYEQAKAKRPGTLRGVTAGKIGDYLLLGNRCGYDSGSDIVHSDTEYYKLK